MEKKFKLNAAMINKNRAFLLLAIVLFCGLFVDNFYTAYNIRAVTGNGSLVIWLGLGFTIVLIAGHMDMTVMYMSTFAALLTLGLHSNQKLPWAICILIGALMGVVNGLIMGLLVTKLKIHAFIASIGMQLVLKGIMYVYCNGSELSIGRDYDLNEKLNNQLLPFLPFSTYFIITTLFVILVIVILRYTRLGRNIHMVGGNAETAWLAGIHSDRVVIAAFIISGLAAGLGGALNPVCCAAAIATIKYMLENDIPGVCKSKGEILKAGLQSLAEKYPEIIQEVRGTGLMLAVEFHTCELGYETAKGLFARRVMTAGTLVNAKTIRFEPTAVISEQDIKDVISRMDEALADTKKELNV